jgi:hypothetical protein
MPATAWIKVDIAGLVVDLLKSALHNLHRRAGRPRRWETGYWCTMDIAHDRAGYYLCWGCLVWVPAVYTSPTLFLVSHPVRWGAPAAAAIAAAGAAAIYINYDSDRQRQARAARTLW